jgi:hypothetical protein
VVAYFDFGFFASFLAGFFGICATSVGVDSTLVAPSATTATAAVAAPASTTFAALLTALNQTGLKFPTRQFVLPWFFF